MKLLLIRHTSVDVPRGVCYGQTDVPLAASFPEEATAVREKLSEYRIDKAFTSPLTRCRRLAEFCGFEDAEIDNRLMEMNFGNWEMKPYDEIDDPKLQEWYNDYLNIVAGGGESAMMQRERFLDFLKNLKINFETVGKPQSGNDDSHKDKIIKEGIRKERSDNEKTIAIFTHGGILIHSLNILKGLSYADAFAQNLPYGAILEFTL